MDTSQTERRAAAPDMETEADIVQKGILLQATLGTIAAVEFLKSQGITGDIIARVLSGEHVRAEDRAALALQAAVMRPS